VFISEFASWQKVHDYLQRYADLFHITERIRFQTRVISIHKDDIKNETIPWIIKVETITGQNETFEFDLVVIATSLYSEPYVPKFRGENKFRGSIVYPSMIKSIDQVENKRVIVIGGGKCATDMAILAGRFARSCHLVFRKAHWMLPRTLMGGYVPMRFLCTRLFAVPFIPFVDAPHTAVFRFLHQKFPKFAFKMNDIIEADIMATNGPDLYNDKIFIPRHSLRNENGTSVISDDFISLKKEGRIIGKLASIDEIIDETTIRLDSGEELKADMIICATGYVRQFPFFSENHAQMMSLVPTSNDDTKTNLYRRIVPVGIPNIGFIGFTASVNYCMVTEAASHWLSDYFLKRLKLPSEKEMYEEIQRRYRFVHELFHNEYYVGYYWVGPLEIYLKDMGLALHRTSNWITEYFGVYRPERLKGLHEERRIKAEKGIAPRRWYFSFEHTIFLILLLIFLFFFF
jgi:cation diffusion facilitator CzcD-associated flavoprotein CzcO